MAIKYIVYIYTCRINHKQYVGQTCNKYGMKGRAKNGRGYKKGIFHNAIMKYGWENFDGIILKDDLTKKEADYWETYYIRKYRTYIGYEDCNGYNMTEGGDGGEMLGYHHTDETREKISKSSKGRFVGKLNPMYGIHDNHICNEDGHLPEEIRKKLSKAAKNRMKVDKVFANKMQSYNEERKRPVNKYDLNGNFICQYESVTILKCTYGNCSSIWRACKRLQKIAYGYQWRYADDCDDVCYLDNKHNVGFKGSIRVVQYDLNNNVIAMYDSIIEASIETNVSYSGISKCCKHKQKTAGSYIWRYADEVENNVLETAI